MEIRVKIDNEKNKELLNILFGFATFWRISTENDYTELGILKERMEKITKEIRMALGESAIKEFGEILKAS